MTDKIKMPMKTTMDYICDADSQVVARLENGQTLDRAKYIVKCCNNYEALLSANKKALLVFNYMSTLKFSRGKDKPVRDLLEKVIKQAEEA